MKSPFSHIKFGEVAEFRNGLNFSKSSHGNGCLLVGIPDFRNRFTPDYESLDEINPAGVAKPEDYLQKGDIVFVRSNGNKALVGRSLYLDQDVKALFSGFCIRARITDDRLDSKFCAYFTRTTTFRSSIASAAGTNINNLNQGILGDARIPLFPKKRQQAIADFLGLLDQKIELNQRTNAALEGMAKLLYDYWFVQFDFPMTAAQATALGKPKLAGHPYRASGGKMIYNETLKREIPEGWEVCTLSQVAKTCSGGTPLSTKREYYDGGNIPWINSGELHSPYIVSASNFITQVGLDNSSAKLLPANTLLIALYGATAGKVSLLLTEACLNQAVCGVIPTSLKILFYLKFVLSDLYSHLVMMSSGSARDNLSQELVRNIKVIIPQSDILGQFDEFVSSGVATAANNIRQNQELTQLRDWLLPMLMNGQVTVG